jgi:hypothetical protein
MISGLGIGSQLKMILIPILIILSVTLSGCIFDDSSKDKKDKSGEDESHGIFLPPRFNRSVDPVLFYGQWTPKVNYSSYGEVTDYTNIYSSKINTSERNDFIQSIELDYEVIFEEPKDKDGNLVPFNLWRYERATRSIIDIYPDIDLGNSYTLEYSTYEKLRSNILNTTTDPIIDGKDLDFYPPRIITTFDYSGVSNTGSTGEVIIKNYGVQGDVLVKVEYDYSIELTPTNYSKVEWKTDKFQIKLPMANSEVVKIIAKFPPDVKFPPLVYIDRGGERHPTSYVNQYEGFQRWEIRYAEAGDTSIGDMTVERL